MEKYSSYSESMFSRLSTYYFFHFATLGVMIPYLGLYLQGIGFSPTQIGSILAVTMATKLVAPLLWVKWLSGSTRPFFWVRWSTFISSIALFGLYWVEGFMPVLFIMLVFSFFWNAILPMMEAVTMSLLGKHTHRYGMIRLWGSVGFVVAVGVAGWLVSVWGALVVIPAMLVTAGGIWLTLLTISPSRADQPPVKPPPLMKLLSRPGIPLLFVIIFLMQLSHGPYYGFFTLYLNEHGLATYWVSFLWVVGVIAEIVFFMFANHVMTRFNNRVGMLLCFALVSVRWVVIAVFPTSLFLLFAVQILHAITFGAFHLLIMRLIQLHFPDRERGQGQALYSSIGYGLGGGVGSYLSGFLWDGFSPDMMWGLGVAAGVLGFIVATKLSAHGFAADSHETTS